jgi:hypothetical protein
MNRSRNPQKPQVFTKKFTRLTSHRHRDTVLFDEERAFTFSLPALFDEKRGFNFLFLNILFALFLSFQGDQHRAGTLKTALKGTYLAFDVARYAHRYLPEVQYRLNRRFNLTSILARPLRATRPSQRASFIWLRNVA